MQKEVQSLTESLPWHPMVPKMVQDDSQTPPMAAHEAQVTHKGLPERGVRCRGWRHFRLAAAMSGHGRGR